MTVDAIVIAAERTLARDGLRRFTTAHVAETAGVSVGTLYQYFPDKLALLAAVAERKLEETHQAFEQLMAAVRPLPLRAALDAMMRGMWVLVRSSQPLHASLYSELYAAGCGDLYRRYLARYTDTIQRSLEERKAEVRVEDTRVAAYVVLCFSEGLAQNVSFDPPPEELTDTFLRECTRLAFVFLTGRT